MSISLKINLGIFLLFISILSSASDTALETYSLSLNSHCGPLKFEAHALKKNKAYVERVFKIVRKDIPPIVKYFNYCPTEVTHIVLDDTASISNGMATMFPRNLIKLFVTTPRGSEHLTINRDPIKALLLHEYVHILHLDQTRGVLRVIRNIFGSIGKLGGLQPRWFTEGIATWAESYFTDYGRLKNHMMKTELVATLKDPSFCQTIDCLDNPGEYPDGQLSYWMGAYFLDFLERKKKGTIRCLVEDNSSNFVFMLNYSFRKCVGKDVSASYQWFRQAFLKEVKKADVKGLAEVGINERYPVWQKGIQLKGDKVVYITKEKEAFFLNEKKVGKKGKSKKILLSRVESLEKRTKYTAEKNEIILSSFKTPKISSERSFIDQNQNLKSTGGKYYFELSKKENIKFLYEKNKWIIVQSNGKRHEGETFTHYHQVTPIQYRGRDYFLFRANLLDPMGSEVDEWRLYDPSTNTVKPLFTSKSNFLFACGEKIYFNGENDFSFNLKTMVLNEISFPKWMNEIVQMESSEKTQVFLMKNRPLELYYKKGNCKKVEGLVKKEKEISRKIVGPSLSNFGDSIQESSSYNSLTHMLPRYWMFSYSGGTDNLDYFTFFTSLNDPKDRHHLSLSLDYYTELSKTSPNITYSWSPNDLTLKLLYMKRFSNSSLSINPNEDQITSASLSYEFSPGSWNLNPGVFASKDSSKDFFSTKKGNSYGVDFFATKSSLSSRSVWRSSQLYARAFQRNYEGFKSYKGYESFGDVILRPNYPIHFLLRGSYGKLDKKDFKSGVINGGGFRNVVHQFYGLNYSELLGNEIWTTRAQGFYNVGRPYSGWGMFPAFLKEIDLTFGVDYAKADFVDFGRYLRRDHKVMSYYWGARFKTVMFYLAPVDLDFIFANVKDDGGDVYSSLLIVNGRFF